MSKPGVNKGFTPGFDASEYIAWQDEKKAHPKEVAERIVQHMLDNPRDYSPYVKVEDNRPYLHDDDKKYILKHVYLAEAEKIHNTNNTLAKTYRNTANSINIGVHTNYEFINMVNKASAICSSCSSSLRSKL